MAIFVCAAALLAAPASAWAQKSVAEILGRPATAEGQPKTYLEELTLFSYVEGSYVANLGRPGRHEINELRFYDVNAGFTFNAAEFSVKKDPSDRYPFGFGVVVTAGEDSQKNHALGIFRSIDDVPPYYRKTPPVDLPEAYVSGLLPLGNGLTLKAGKWATLTGYEVYESPKNIQFSRSFLYTIGTPYTHTGVIGTYRFAPWVEVTAGVINGWDTADNNNGQPRGAGQFAFTPIDKLTANLNWIVGNEQNRNVGGGIRWLLDWVVSYTGIDRVTLGLNFDIAGESKEPSLAAAGKGGDANWGGVAVYGAYDWTKALRTAIRLEYFADRDGVRNGVRRAGSAVDLYNVTATGEHKLWRGLVGRLEYRHDQADKKVFSVHPTDTGIRPTARSQDTLTFAVYYSFF